MKGIVVDIEGRYAVALSKSGSFIKIKNNGRLIIGNEIQIPSMVGSIPRIASIAAVLVLALGLGFGAYTYSMPYAYINVDINPSVEITVNIYDRIINAEAINEDGKELLSSGSLRNKSMDAGIDDIVRIAVEKGYLLKDSENAVMITVSSKSDKKAGQMEEKAQSAIREGLEDSNIETEILTQTVTVEKRTEARNQGISPGKQLLINRLIEVSPEANIEYYKEAPVKEIMKSIKEMKKLEKAQEKDSKKQEHEDKKQDNKGINNNKDTEDSNIDDGENTARPTAAPVIKNNGKDKKSSQGKTTGNSSAKAPGQVKKQSGEKVSEAKPEDLKDAAAKPDKKDQEDDKKGSSKKGNEGNVENKKDKENKIDNESYSQGEGTPVSSSSDKSDANATESKGSQKGNSDNKQENNKHDKKDDKKDNEKEDKKAEREEQENPEDSKGKGINDTNKKVKNKIK